MDLPLHKQFRSHFGILSDLRSIYLFNVSEHKTVIAPQILFALVAALSGPIMSTNAPSDTLSVLYRTPLVAIYVYLNVLAFTITNQRLPEFIAEDTINKSWRPLPAGRLTTDEARKLLLYTIAATYSFSAYFGGREATATVMVLTWMYNDLGLADADFALRSLMNALGLSCYSIGAAEIACGGPGNGLNQAGMRYVFIIGAIVLNTIVLADFRDQEGDRLRSRSTAPLVWGDKPARWFTAVSIMVWSFAAPAFWELHVVGYLPSVLVGSLITARLLLCRSASADAVTWKLWGLWMMAFFTLPLFKNPTSIFSMYGGLREVQ